MNLWLCVLGCLLVSFVFSGIEAGILSINRVRLRHQLKLQDPAAVLLNRLLVHPERLLITVLLVTNLMNIIALSLVVEEFAKRWGLWGYWLAGAVAIPVWGVGLELLPKSLFRRFPYRALAALSGPLRVADTLLYPVHFVGIRLLRALPVSKSRRPQKLFSGREDFKYLTFESERQGALSAEERAMIHSVVDFRSWTAMDLMVSIARTGAVLGSLGVKEARERARLFGADRVPVISADGEVTGVVDFHELAVNQHWHGQVEVFQRRILRVKPTDSAYGLLRKLRASRQFMAVVRDEAGHSLGIVFWDDLIQRLFLPERSEGGMGGGREVGFEGGSGI
jgi:CBS domain containing-hemolysin-like protein